ncbi:MAG: hypothetical protein PWR01_4714, partial [Clostridiales bacterium]|nr:hypothetical protein [Clostridiales bacterium]MDN5283641.1 hypothetical protein [Candidatus Ozemobacter sp.]
MIRKIALILVFTLMTVSGFAFDKAEFQNNLKDLSESIAQTAYTLSEKASSAERTAYEATADRADKSEKRIREILSKIETAQDF